MMGPYSFVYDLEIFNGQLIATGGVIEDEGIERFVSRWNGTTWEEFGPDNLYGEYPFLADLAVYRDTLYLAGSFHLAADDSVGNLARWRDGSWEVVGGGTDGRVSSLQVFHDELIVGGRFSHAGNASANNIAAWNGTSWATLGEGLQSDGYSYVGILLVSNDRLFVGGSFDSAGDAPVRDVAVWDGAAWDSLAPLPNLRIFPICLTSFENRIIAGGRFALDRVGVANVMAWDGGTTWSPVSTWGVELVGTPRALLATPEGLVCDGEFTLPGQLESKSAIARWDGSDWQIIGDRLDLPVSAFAIFRGEIVAAGWFQTIDGDSLRYIARWDGDSWHPLGAGLSGPGLALAVHRDRLIVAGTFVYAGGEPLRGIAEWDGQSWRRFGSGILGRVTDVAIYNDEVYACGRFTWAGETPARSLAKWNGARWESIDRELTFEDDDAWVSYLELWNGQLVAAGNFETVAGAEARDLAIWNGIHWRPLTPLLDMTVSELASDQGRLVVGGAFYGPNGHPDQDYIRQWDGSRWLRMGSGLSSGRDGYSEFPSVTAIARWDGGLYVSGLFRFAGRNPSFRIARWDGSAFGAPISKPTLTVAPNPAVDTVHFSWHLDDPGNVQLRVFNVLGREVAWPVRGLQPGGPGTDHWALIDDQGRQVPAGVYFVRLESERGSAVSRVVVLR
jgi:hypothetical protein